MLSSIIKFIVPFVLLLVGLFQTFYYRKIKRVFEGLPVVASEVIRSDLHDDPFTNPGRREYVAMIDFKYTFRGKEYVSSTPALRGYRLWPDYQYESNLLERYKKGDIVNARVVEGSPSLAYLEVAPLHKVSAILMPFVMIGYFLFFGAYVYLFSAAPF